MENKKLSERIRNSNYKLDFKGMDIIKEISSFIKQKNRAGIRELFHTISTKYYKQRKGDRIGYCLEVTEDLLYQMAETIDEHSEKNSYPSVSFLEESLKDLPYLN